MSNKVKSPLMKKAPTYSLRASIISILIGLLTGAVVILIVGAFNPLISLKGAWDGIRLVLFACSISARLASTWPVPQLPCSWRFPFPAAAFPPGSSGSSPSWAVCWPVPCGALSPAC